MLTFYSLLAHPEYSDLVIICGDSVWDVHKAIVCARSTFFKNAERFPKCEVSYRKRDMKSILMSSYQATDKETIKLPADEPDVVRRLIQYLYEAEYNPKLPDGSISKHAVKTVPDELRQPDYHYSFPHTCKPKCPDYYRICPHHNCTRDTCGEHCVNFTCKICCPPGARLPAAEGDASQLLLHAKMYEMGDKYDVIGLQDLAREKFLRACAVYYHDERFTQAARHAFSTTPDHDIGLRDVVKDVIWEHMDLLKKAEVQALVQDSKGLAMTLLMMC